jgi:fucose 4-O-acetylase-like acetyltransferase
VDAFKGIGILLVIVGHTSRIPWVTQFIYSFHMPLFFWLSGYLFTLRPFRKFLRRKSATLLVPYVFFGVTTWIFWAFVEHDYSGSMDQAWPVLLNVFVGKPGNVNYQADAPLWFLLALFLAETVLLCVVAGSRAIAAFSVPEISHSRYISDEDARHHVRVWRKVVEVSVVALVTVGAATAGALIVNAKMERWPIALDIVPTAFAFMGFGYVCRSIVTAAQHSEWMVVWRAARNQARALRVERASRAARMAAKMSFACDPLAVLSGISSLPDIPTPLVDSRAKRIFKVCAKVLFGLGIPFGVGVLVDVMLRDHGVHVDLANDVMRKPVYFYIAAVTMTLMIVIVAHAAANLAWLRYLGNASLGIMCVHDLAKGEFANGLSAALDMDRTAVQQTPVLVALLCMLILGSSLAVYEVVKRVFPFALGLRGGIGGGMSGIAGGRVGVALNRGAHATRKSLARGRVAVKTAFALVPSARLSSGRVQRGRSVSASYQSSLR